ncbi:DinB family protein [Metabacillus sp. JX24]|uniref:DinB family protein n=1 Tax=Metabacillus sp. JX24 TaxID=3240759 RepID=UPI00350FC0A8
MKTLDEMYQHYSDFTNWVISLEFTSEELWHHPIDHGKWSVAELISHLISWDRFTLEQRLQNIHMNAVLDPFPDIEAVNSRAAVYAKSGIGKKALIQEFVKARSAVVEEFRSFTGKECDFKFSIGDHPFTIAGYMEEFIHHDLHHKAQIDAFLNKMEKSRTS